MRWPKPVLVALVVLFLLSLALNAFLLWRMVNAPQQPAFALLSPDVAHMSIEDFLTRQQTYVVSYSSLRPEIRMILANRSGEYGIYFEDLTTGAWLGVNERTPYYPMSLLKVPVMIAAYKKVEAGEITLNDTIFILPEDINTGSGALGLGGPGQRATLGQLVTIMIRDSDNTATLTLRKRVLSQDEYVRAGVAMGLALHTEGDAGISPKEYSNILRSLYFSSYLRRPFSEMALRNMINTSHNDWLPAGIPAHIAVAHKVGIDDTRGIYHDCGIVYLPEHPYLLCMMSKNATQEEATQVMINVSSTVYHYMAQRAQQES